MLKKILILLLITSIMSGCSVMRLFDTKESTTLIDNELVCRVPFEFEPPSPVRMRDVTFFVLTPEIMSEIVEGNTNNRPTLYYALTLEGYEGMAYNMLEINRFLEANKILFRALQDYLSAD